MRPDHQSNNITNGTITLKGLLKLIKINKTIVLIQNGMKRLNPCQTVN